MLVALTNTKGGVGKSTIAVHLAVWLHERGSRVALLDTDKQLSSSQWISEAESNITVGTAHTPDDCLAKARGLLESHDWVIADGPAGLDDISRTLLLLADLAVFPVTPSILDLRSLSQATKILKYAQDINQGKPSGRLVLNKIKTRDKISRDLEEAAPQFGISVASSCLRDLRAYRDAAQQGTVVSRMGKKCQDAATDMESVCCELTKTAETEKEPSNIQTREVANG